MADVYVNGKFVGTVKEAKTFVDSFITERRSGSVSEESNIYFDELVDDVHIQTSKGRARRPLIIVRDGVPLLTQSHVKQLQKGEIVWDDLVKQGVIEYLDAMEEENALVAFSEDDLTKEHTHMQISPVDMVGFCTSLVPFGHHNQLTKLNGGSKNQKQAVGFYAANYHLRMDMDINILHTPQVPLVQTMMHDITDYHLHPSGQNVTIAVMSYEGYNMEDAIILNKGSVDRGLARSTYFRPAVAEELRYTGGLVDEICVPDKDVKGYRTEHDYRFLEEDGIIHPEATVGEGDVIIGKVSPPRFLSGADEYNLASNSNRESSVNLKHGEEGVVDFVALTENQEGNKFVQVRLREQRIPEIGDKFTSRHGQKGVIGLIVNQGDVPFSVSGVQPDLIFSPHSVPSRQTISHMIEIIGGKVGALAGRYIDGTLFDSESESSIREELASLGFCENGTETLYNPITGEQYKARIFMGNMYYLKLRHMVANKIHSRARGPIQLLTRQPTEGRAKEGGLRLGEMEKDTLVAHGASLLLKERFNSDSTVVWVSEKSGLLAVNDAYNKRVYDLIYGDNTEVHPVEISYAFKLFLDELKAMGIYPKMELKDKY
jgi:DNA-directed RNA polymerase subunit B'